MSQMKNRVILPTQGATPRPFFVSWEAPMVDADNKPAGNLSGDSVYNAFRLTHQQIEDIKKSIFELVQRNLPEGSPRPMGIVIRQILELEG